MRPPRTRSVSDLACRRMSSSGFWVPEANYLSNLEFSLSWQLARNTLPVNNVKFKTDVVDRPDCHRCVREFWGDERVSLLPLSTDASVLGPCWQLTDRIDPEHLLPIDLAYVCGKESLPWYGGETTGVSHAAMSDKNSGVGEANGWNLSKRTLFSSVSSDYLGISSRRRSELTESYWFWQISA